MDCRSRATGERSPQDRRVRQAGWLDLAYLVYFVHLAHIVQPNRPKTLERQAGSRVPRATVYGAGGLVQHLFCLPLPC